MSHCDRNALAIQLLLSLYLPLASMTTRGEKRWCRGTGVCVRARAHPCLALKAKTVTSCSTPFQERVKSPKPQCSGVLCFAVSAENGVPSYYVPACVIRLLIQTPATISPNTPLLSQNISENILCLPLLPGESVDDTGLNRPYPGPR